MDARLTDGVERAAGGVLWRRSQAAGPRAADVEVAVVHRPKYADWTFPKGKLDPGESDLEAALREIEEETSYTGSPGRNLGDISYVKTTRGKGVPKVVHYWEIRAAGGSFVPNQEVDDLRWLTPGEAEALLSKEGDRDILRRFSRGPVTTSVVVMVRHASAGSRSEWVGDDRIRPLDSEGRRQATALVALLRPWAIEEIVSADFVRCTQTVEPLSESIGVPIKQDPIFSELGYPGNEATGVEALRSLATHGAAVCVCSQGDVIPDLLSRVAEQDGLTNPSPSGKGPETFEAKKGGVWVLCWSGDRLCGAESLGPPSLEEPPSSRNAAVP